MKIPKTAGSCKNYGSILRCEFTTHGTTCGEKCSHYEEKLKRCPFCGSESACVSESHGQYAVVCDCGASGSVMDTEEEAFEVWQNRTH